MTDTDTDTTDRDAEAVRADCRDALREYLDTVSTHDPETAEYLAHGEFRTPTGLTDAEQALISEMDDTIGFEPKSCYYNAQLAAIEWDDVAYVEGYAITGTTGVPFQHAWLEFVETGHLAEVTLTDDLRQPDIDVYYGKTFEAQTIAEQQGEQGTAAPLAGDAIEWEPPESLRFDTDT